MKLTKRERILLLGALIIAFMVIFLKYIYLPLREDVKALKSQAYELSTQIEGAKQKQALVEVLEKQLSKIQEDDNTSYEDVMKNWDEPVILVYLEQTLDELGFSNMIENYGVVPEEEGYLNGNINLKLTATNENLMKILKKFEEGKYFSTVETMEVAEADNLENNANKKELDINLILKFYSLDYMKEYTDDYKFMKGKFGKTNIFE